MISVLELTKEYIEVHDLRAATAKTYLSSANALIKLLGNCPAEEIDHRTVLNCRKKELDRGLAKRSWNTYSSHLRTVFKYAIEEKIIHLEKNPFYKSSLIPPRGKKKIVVDDAIEHARTRLKLLKDEEQASGKRSSITPAWFWLVVYETFFYTGIRLNALLNLKVGDIDLKHRFIHVRAETEKTHREFLIPIPDGLLPFLGELKQAATKRRFSKSDQIFNVNRFSPHYRGKLMNIDQVESMYKKLMKSTGVRMTPHRFRHTIATDLMKQPDRNIHITKTLLNHSNLQTTMGYIEPDYEMMRIVMNERSLPAGLDYYMSRTRTNDRNPSQERLRVKREDQPILKIDRTLHSEQKNLAVSPPNSIPPQPLSTPRSHEQTTTPLPGLGKLMECVRKTLSSEDKSPSTAKCLDWLRDHDVDLHAQARDDDSHQNISEQLEGARGAFEGTTWASRLR